LLLSTLFGLGLIPFFPFFSHVCGFSSHSFRSRVLVA
jgi:hypothetical protein